MVKQILNIVTLFLGAPRYFIFSSKQVKQGMHIERISRFYKNQKTTRGNDSQVNEIVEQLERDGLVIIEDYLSEEDFNCIEKVVQQRMESGEIDCFFNKDGYGVDWEQFVFNSSELIVESSFTKNIFIRSIVEAYTQRKVLFDPELIYQRLLIRGDQKDHRDPNSVLHADRFYPTLKIFFAMDEQTIQNGAFRYCVGSNMVDHERLSVEEDIAFREALLLEGRASEIDSINLKNGRNVLNKKELARYKEKVVVAKKNTLIIADVSGYHRRGQILEPNNDRQLLRLIFHYVYAPQWGQRIFSMLGLKPSRRLN